jgi:hypothetical protein
MGNIRNWYWSQPPWARLVNFFALVIGTIGLIASLAKSGTEFRAIAWHHHHGDHVTISGVTFPVYYWYAPDVRDDRLLVIDEPGPLRPSNDTFTSFTIDGRRDKNDKGTPLELAQRDLEHAVSDFEERSTFEWTIRSQHLECMQERSDSTSISVVFCYGDGPIFHLSFVGKDHSLEKLKRMLADAR